MKVKEKIQTIDQVRQETIFKIHSMAEQSFKDHRITPLFIGLPLDSSDMNWDYRGWRCKKPGSGFYAFDLLSIPGRLIITGDMGCLVAEREYDMIEWARTAVKDIYYFAGKVDQCIRKRYFSVDVAKAWLNEDRSRIKRGMWSALDNMDEHEFKKLVYESTLDSEMPDFDDWCPSFLWLREAVMWFLDHYHPSIR